MLAKCRILTLNSASAYLPRIDTKSVSDVLTFLAWALGNLARGTVNILIKLVIPSISAFGELTNDR
jgi:hypothetical protein